MSGEDRFLVRIEAWPHSTSRGASVDQIQAGRREHAFEVKADDLRGALACAELISTGMQTGPLVWQTPITEIRKLKHDERVPHTFDQHCEDLHAAAKLRMPMGDRS